MILHNMSNYTQEKLKNCITFFIIQDAKHTKNQLMELCWLFIMSIINFMVVMILCLLFVLGVLRLVRCVYLFLSSVWCAILLSLYCKQWLEIIYYYIPLPLIPKHYARKYLYRLASDPETIETIYNMFTNFGWLSDYNSLDPEEIAKSIGYLNLSEQQRKDLVYTYIECSEATQDGKCGKILMFHMFAVMLSDLYTEITETSWGLEPNEMYDLHKLLIEHIYCLYDKTELPARPSQLCNCLDIVISVSDISGIIENIIFS